MPEVRRVAATLPLVATQKGAAVDPLTARGPIPVAPRGRAVTHGQPLTTDAH